MTLPSQQQWPPRTASPPQHVPVLLAPTHPSACDSFWTGPVYPNSTTYPTGTLQCGAAGCLFNVLTDPYEQHEVSAQHPGVVAELAAEIAKAQVR